MNSETALVFLYILSIYGATVGFSLGVLLPLLFPGVCLGSAFALLSGAFLQNNNYVATQLYFPTSAGGLAIIFAFLSSR